ncbi:hypothetical protein GCM10027456_76560 [Kineosporia babensis]
MTGPPIRRYTRRWSSSTFPTRCRLLIVAALAGALLAVLLVGPPLLLIILAGPPWTTVQNMFEPASLEDPLRSLESLVVIGSWLGWSVLALEILRAGVDVRRELAAPGMASGTGRGGSPKSWRLRGVIVGLVLAPLSAPASAMASAHAVPVAASPTGPTPDLSPASAPRPRAIDQEQHQTVRVQPWGSSTTLWGLAEEHLGDGARWREIWDLNEGREQRDGTVMRSPSILVPGWTVLIPAADVPAASPSPATARQSLRYSIAEGDRLGDVAVRFLGEFTDYQRIQQVNRDQIPDPDHIEAGETIVLPAEALDRGQRQHAGGSAESPKPTEADDPAENQPPPRRRNDQAPQQRSGNDRPHDVSLPAEHQNDERTWLLPAAAAATAALVAAILGRHRRRRSRSEDQSTGSEPMPLVEEPLQIEPEDDWLAGEVTEGDFDPSDGFEDTGHSDAAIDEARAFVHQSALKLRQRQQETTAPATPDSDQQDDQGPAQATSPAYRLRPLRLRTSAEIAGADREPGPAPSGEEPPRPTVRELETPQRTEVQVRLFGDPAVLTMNGDRVHGLRKHALQLLLYLALHPGGTELSVLREVMWADLSLSKASGRLSTEVASLRRTVRTALGDAENLRINAVTNINGSYELADFVVTDVQEFEAALKEALNSPEKSADRERLLRRAIELHSGQLADRANLDFIWLHSHQRRLNRAGARARMLLAELVRDRNADEARALVREAARLDLADRVLQEQVVRTNTTLGL